MTEELEFVNLYAPNAKTKLQGRVDYISFNSMPVFGRWTIKMTFNDGKQKPYTITEKYKFSTNYFATIACDQIAKAFERAVQRLLQKLYYSK